VFPDAEFPIFKAILLYTHQALHSFRQNIWYHTPTCLQTYKAKRGITSRSLWQQKRSLSLSVGQL